MAGTNYGDTLIDHRFHERVKKETMVHFWSFTYYKSMVKLVIKMNIPGQVVNPNANRQIEKFVSIFLSVSFFPPFYQKKMRKREKQNYEKVINFI